MAKVAPQTNADAIRPFSPARVPETELADLRKRITATKWPERETVRDGSQGVQLATMQKLARYWANDYDWRRCEAKLAALPQFVTEIEGLDIHFIHIRSKHADAMPLVVTHGWPGSIIENLKIIPALTDPTAHGGSASEAFHLVIPSLPGFGYSGKPATPGWDPVQIARAWVVLMKRLGYTRFGASGGDWGAFIGDLMAKQAPPELVGIHTNLPNTAPPELVRAARDGLPPPPELAGEELHAYEQMITFLRDGIAYALEMGNRPQTLYGIVDSPIGLASWILDHDIRSYELIARVFDGQTEGLTRDDILDNITFYWFTNTGVSASRIYWENETPFLIPQSHQVPTIVSAFPDELYCAPRSWAEKAYPKLVYYKRHDKGGHFAAWEQPQRYVGDLREGFRTLR
jgi:pimeloyl-ACP methyl ester carboxylesterase